MTMHHVKANFKSASTRRETWHGRDHLVVPVVMIVEGVLNGALITAEEFGTFPAAWNGRPVPVWHPEQNGQSVSANSPDIIERNTIGSLFNTHADGNKLKSEAWLDIQKAESLGFGPILVALESGGIMEVSTGYFAEAIEAPGTFNGVPYSVVHKNIRPDHLALLPDEIGACSVEDGCGTRANSKKELFAMKVNDAWAALGKALGLNVNCQCEENKSMDILEEAGKLVKTNAITPAQFKMLQEMSPEDRAMMQAIASALGEVGASAPEEDPEDMMDPDMEEDRAAMREDYEGKNMSKKGARKKNAGTVTQDQIDKMVANGVKEHLRRNDVVTKLVANERNTLTEEQMASMSVDHLEAVEKMIRPVDYSGAGGFSSNGGGDAKVTPMPLRGVLSKKKEA